jgi:hypothetical protein
MKVKKLEAVRDGANSVKAYVEAVKSGWGVRPSKNLKAAKPTYSTKSSKIFENQKEAVEYAREVALKYQNELSIHGSNGKIKEKFVHGEYSFPPRG